MINQRWRNAIVNIDSDTTTKFPSDHYPLTASFKLRLEKPDLEKINSNLKWKGVQKPFHDLKVVQKNEAENNRYPSYPTEKNLALENFSDDFYDNFEGQIQTEDQLFPQTEENLMKRLSLYKKLYWQPLKTI